MTDDLTIKQKERILTAYTEYLKAKTELGVKPTEAEMQLLKDGHKDLKADIEEKFQQVMPLIREMFEHQRSEVAELVPKLVGDEE